MLARRIKRRADRATREDSICSVNAIDQARRTLRDHDELFAKRLELHGANIESGEIDVTRRGLDEPKQRGQQTRFA